MLPSVCAAMFPGCTAMPASIATQTLWTLILPDARSTETSATPAARVSSFTMVAAPSARPSRLRVQSDISATARSSVCMRGWPSDSSSRNAIGSLPSSFAISSMKHSAANALWPLPTPRQGAMPRAARHHDVLGELVGDRVLRDRRALHHDAVEPRRRRAGHRGRIGHHQLRDHAVVPGDQLAAGVEARLDVMRGHRTEFSEGDVILPAPDELHRLADGLRQPHRVEDHLVLPAAAETAAEDMLMQRELRAVRLQQPRNLVEQARLRLACRPRSPPTCRRR